MTSIILHLLDSAKYIEGVIKIFKTVPKSRSVIYVTTNKPYSVITSVFKKKGIKTDKIFFVDCISKHLKESGKEPSNCIFIESPQNLTAISIAITKLLAGLSGPKMLFFDSLSILLIYNDSKTISKFSNFLFNKMRSFDVDSVMIALESDEGKDVIRQIASFADEVKKW